MFFSMAFIIPTYMFFKYHYVVFPTSSPPDDWDPSPILFWDWIMQVLYSPILALVKSSVLVFLLRLGGHNRGVRWTIYGLNGINLVTMTAIFLVVLFQTIPINALWDPNMPKRREINGTLFYIASAIITIITNFLSTIEVNLSIIAACIPALRPLFRKRMPQMFPNKSANGNRAYNNGHYSRHGNGVGNVTGNRPNTAGNGCPLKDLHGTHTEIRGHSPNGREEEFVNFNGIIKTTNGQVTYDGFNPTMVR
ncbi:hypothetical protein CCHL11_00201 [Colletotrichum chlorophyti]|uniref:Rhodopsin domain-containing protein n=1 Tax=Colletotrichum chlorophyti TaxID=708187 RepID=A0A1Q8RVB4_9PEZI|nr:hypothetical protein CCHL11_00201 [Colletotrichum chlorophyti]